jgi:hypothetical protein
VARVPAIFPRNGRFGDFNLRRLTFTLESGPDSERDLVLRQNPILMDMDSDERSAPLVLARDVSVFTVECWNTNTLEWVGEWDDTNSIPSILRVGLVFGGSTDSHNQASALAITRVITTPSMMLPSVLQTPRSGGINNQNNNNNQNNQNNNNQNNQNNNNRNNQNNNNNNQRNNSQMGR